MNLLDRYLEAVRKHLPWQRQDDIIAELRANLESQLEEKEASLGRPLTAAEAEEWIKQLGSPLQVAAGYQPQQYLIGPTLFPTYRHVLKLACSWCLLIYTIVNVVQIVTAQNPSGTDVIGAFLRVPGTLLITAAWVTVVFAALEYAIAHHCINIPLTAANGAGWSIQDLPPFPTDYTPGKKPRTFIQAAIESAFGFLFLAWLLAIPSHPWLVLGPGAFYLKASPYVLAPVWMQFYWCVVALNVVQLGWGLENLVHGTWQKPQPMKNIVIKALGLIPCLVLVAASDHVLVLLRNPAVDQVRYGATLDSINLAVYRSMLVITAIAALQLIWEIVRFTQNVYRKRAAAMR